MDFIRYKCSKSQRVVYKPRIHTRPALCSHRTEGGCLGEIYPPSLIRKLVLHARQDWRTGPLPSRIVERSYPEASDIAYHTGFRIALEMG